MKVYVVMGTSGDYSDRREWVVCAYTDEALAKQHVELAQARSRETWAAWEDAGGWGCDLDPADNEYDPRSPDLTMASTYWCEEVAVFNTIPDAVESIALDRAAVAERAS